MQEIFDVFQVAEQFRIGVLGAWHRHYGDCHNTFGLAHTACSRYNAGARKREAMAFK